MFEFDEAKNSVNRVKHGLDFADAIEILEDRKALLIDASRTDDGEQRVKAVGLRGARLHTVVYTWRGTVRRIISFRKANAKEIREYKDING